MKNYEKFSELVNSAKDVLITSHISPDPDAVSSLLLLGTTLILNYPDKDIKMVLEEEPTGLEFLEGYEQIQIKPLLGSLEERQPDLLILLDGNNYERCSRHDGQKVRVLVLASQIKSIIVDHHEKLGSDETDLFINDNYPATVQNVYEILYSSLNLEKPEGYAKTTMVGLYADTGGFVYMKDGRHNDVFELANELVNSGVNLEEIKNLLSQFDDDDMKILGELANNVSHIGGCTYSFISDRTIENWLKSGKSQIELQRSTGNFLDEYIRNISGRKWGFIVYKNTLQGENYYSASFRALGEAKDVSQIANLLGGGGHKPAAGAKFEAANAEDAIERVKQAISGAVDED